jgi:hypothetical protein
MTKASILALALVLGSQVGALGEARAQVDCTTLPNPVYFPATSDIRPVLSRIAPTLSRAQGADQMTIVYRSLSSCPALEYVLNDADLDGTAIYWTGNTLPDGKPEEGSCTMPAGVKASLAASDIAIRTCTGMDPPAAVREISSLVQTFVFIVPPNSNQKAITAEEGYFLMKFGGEAEKQVPPWTNPQFVVIRNPGASTQLVIGLAIGVPGTMWSANLTNTNSGSGDVISKVVAENTTGNAEATIGILSTQRYDQERARLKSLAFQSFDQCRGAFYPDSTASAVDKKNVRDGHYPVWAFLRFAARIEGGEIRDPRAKKLVDLFTGTATVAGVNVTEATIKAGGVPVCAMKVTRDFDGGPLEPFQAPEPCDCFYEKTATGNTTCTECSDATPCTGGKVCRLGYCEAR